jgi:hypothetical protein
LLLVGGLARGVGNAEPDRNRLASTPCGVTIRVPLRDGYRMLRQLGKESNLSLRHDWPIVSHRGHRILAVRRAMASRYRRFGLDIRPVRDGERISAGMAVWEARCVA